MSLRLSYIFTFISLAAGISLTAGCEEEGSDPMFSPLEGAQRDAGLTLGGQASAGAPSAGVESSAGSGSDWLGSAAGEGGAQVSNGGGSSDAGEAAGGAAGQSAAGASAALEPDQADQPYGDSSSSSVLCGEQSCDLASETCCLREFGASCVEGADATCDLGGTPLICDGPEDCNGGQCCLGVGLPGALECSATPCVNLTLCHLDQDCAEDQVCRRCQFTGLALAVCARPNVYPNLALSCE